VLAIYLGEVGASADPDVLFDLSGPGFAPIVAEPFPQERRIEVAGARLGWHEAAERLLEPPHQRRAARLGRDLAEGLLAAAPDATRAGVCAYFAAASSPWSRRLVVCAEPATLASELPFEALLFPAPLASEGRPPQEPVADADPITFGRVHLLRFVDRPEASYRPAVAARLRVLLVVGSIEQTERAEARDAELAAAVLATQQQLAGLAPHVELRVIVTAGALAGVHTDHRVHAPEDVLAHVAEGFHVVHYLGHARPSDRPGVAELVIRFPGEQPADLKGDQPAKGRAEGQSAGTREKTLTSIQLAGATRGTENRIVVLSACTTAGQAADAMLGATDHVVATAGELDPAHFVPWCAAFYGTLAQGRSVGEAVQKARATLPPTLRWTTQHSARTLETHALVDTDGQREWLYRRYVHHAHRSLLGQLFSGLGVEHEDVLGELYVELRLSEQRRRRLRSDHTAAPRESAVAPELGGDLPAPHARAASPSGLVPLRDLVVDFADSPDGNRWLVLADPGAGKTTTLRHLARELARDPNWLPVYLHLSTWPRAHRRLVPLAEALAGTRADLATLLARFDVRRRAVLLLDGLDEQPPQDRLAVKEMLDWLVVELQSPIVLATRKVGFRDNMVPAEFAPVRLPSLNNLPDPVATKTELLGKWFRLRGRTDADAAARACQLAAHMATGDLREVTDTPLLVHLVALLHDVAEEGDEDALPASAARHRIYDQVLDALVLCRHRPDETGLPLHETRLVLRHLAFVRACAGRDLTQAEMTARMREWKDSARDAYEALAATDAARSHWQAQPEVFLEVIANRTGLLAPHAGGSSALSSTPWGFWVKPLQDALVGEHLYHALYEPAHEGRQPHAAAANAVLDALGPHLGGTIDGVLPQWGEALAVLTGWISEQHRAGTSAAVDAWLEAFVERDLFDLALRAFAFTAAGGAQIVERMAAGLRVAEDRIKLYQELPARVRDPRVAAALLGRLAEERSAEDLAELYELDELLRALPHDEPTQAAVKTACDALFARFPRLEDRDAMLHLPPASEGVAADTERGSLWCEVPSGWFRRGSPESEGYPEEHPAMPVHLTKPFVIGATTITQEQYALFDPSHRHRWPGDHMPVTGVNWYAATMFARWLGHHLGVEGRLPTEAEWEYACRGQRCESAEAVHGASWPPYWCGDPTEAVAWFGKGPVGGPRPAHDGDSNPFGLRNVHGNVWEWCTDWFGPYEADPDGTRTDPTGPMSGSARVLRGGCYWGGAAGCRSAFRYGFFPVTDYDFIGFRVVLSARPG